MFEKEAIKHAFENTIGIECLDKPIEDFSYEELSDELQEKAFDFQKGAEFGYNKANEWHYVKDGIYPTDENDVQVLYQDCDKINVYNCIYDVLAENWLYYNLDDMILELFPFKVIAWKEIVLPKESE